MTSAPVRPDGRRPIRPAADQLMRLRWRLTVLFTVMNTIGLVVFAWLVIGGDRQRGEEQLDATLNRSTASVLRLIQYSNGGLIDFSRVSADEINSSCPEFYITDGGNRSFPGHASRKDCVQVDRSTVDALAKDAIGSGRRLSEYADGPDGNRLRVAVDLFRETSGGPVTGAVVAVADADDEAGRHQRVMLIVLGASIVLVCAAALGGYALAGRAIRPAVHALEQQEVLLAETAHDLRTPVAALRALAETAAGDPAQRSELLARTVRLSSRMGDIIDALLVRARLAAGVEQLAIQPVWLDQLVAGVIEDIAPDLPNVTLVAAPTKVNADPTLVRRAIGNLIGNALRHGRTPGQPAVVTVTVANGRVTVADQGPGIDAEIAEQMFDRFSSSAGSSGLGLSIVRWVAEAHGGTLGVYNAEEGGAIFDFALPVDPSH